MGTRIPLPVPDGIKPPPPPAPPQKKIPHIALPDEWCASALRACRGIKDPEAFVEAMNDAFHILQSCEGPVRKAEAWTTLRLLENAVNRVEKSRRG